MATILIAQKVQSSEGDSPGKYEINANDNLL